MISRIRRGGRSGTRKYGRNEAKCARYKREKRREKNRIRKLKKIFKKQPNNYQIARRVKELQKYVVSSVMVAR